eukprot:CAMPEP_0168422706 /NCGR_PEP_ID=MMETSP0228-20121227/33933_1 /TAXON_ID=133427 /ORGANISM="Protoceratium reticulatum, Strain CCCM 535 (=CCMP 1889)" /LENGTH=125 /DNA_ID=CAMNT_0008436649 /DNA_START=107 /DNA_END=481 /DNA_ORIENTATION=+
MVHVDPYHRQFESSGPTVYVRNTFLDCDSAPKMPVLRRGSTAPATITPWGDEMQQRHQDDDYSPCHEQPSTPPLSPTLARLRTFDPFVEAQLEPLEPADMPTALCRAQTVDPLCPLGGPRRGDVA